MGVGTTHPCPSLLGYSAAAANVDLQTGESLVPTETTAPTQEGAIAAVEPRPVQVDNQVRRVRRSQVDLRRVRQPSVTRSDATTCN